MSEPGAQRRGEKRRSRSEAERRRFSRATTEGTDKANGAKRRERRRAPKEEWTETKQRAELSGRVSVLAEQPGTHKPKRGEPARDEFTRSVARAHPAGGGFPASEASVLE